MHSEHVFSWDRLWKSVHDVLGKAEGWRAVVLRILVALGFLGYTAAAAVRPEQVLPATPAGRWAALAVLVGFLALGIQAVYSKRREIESFTNDERRARDDRRDASKQALALVFRDLILAALTASDDRSEERKLSESLLRYSESVSVLPGFDAHSLSPLCAMAIAESNRRNLRGVAEAYEKIQAHHASWPITYRDRVDWDELRSQVKALKVLYSPKYIEQLQVILRSSGKAEKDLRRLLDLPATTAPGSPPPSSPGSS